MNAGLIFSTRPGLCLQRRTSRPHRTAGSRFSPAFAGRCGPGSPGAFRGRGHVADLQVLDPDQVEAPRDVCGHLLGPVFAPVRLAGAQPGDRVLDPARRFEPAWRGRECAAVAAAWSAPRGQGGAVQQLAGGQGRGDRHAPVDAYRLAVTRCGNRPGDHREGDMPAARRGPGSPGRTSRLAAPRGTSGTAPTRPWAPRPGRRGGRPGALPLRAAPTIRNPSSRPALRHDGRPAGLAGSKNAAIAWVKSRRPAAAPSGSRRPATGTRPGPG